MGRQAKPDGSTRVACSHGHEYIWEKQNGKWRLQHRIVIEHELGRTLGTHEHVHHIDEDTLNNKPENLTLVTARAHVRHHNPAKKPKRPRVLCARDGCRNHTAASDGLKYCSARCKFYATHVTVTCHMCGVKFIAYRSQHKKFCSVSCASKYRHEEVV